MSTSLRDEYIGNLREALELGFDEGAFAEYLKALNAWLWESVDSAVTYHRIVSDAIEVFEQS